MSMIKMLTAQREQHTEAQRALLAGISDTQSLSDSAQAEFDGHSAAKRAIDARIDAAREVHGDASARRSLSLSAIDPDLNSQFRDAIKSKSRAPIEVFQAREDMRSGYQPGLEYRDQLTTSGGGLTGVTFYNTLQRHMVESSAILSAGATVITTSTGEPLKIPKTTAFSTATITAEAAPITESDPTLGSVTLQAFKYGFLVQVSTELANDAAFDLLGWLAYQAGQAIGNAFGADAIVGAGTTAPRGITLDATLGNTGPVGTTVSLGAQTTVGMGGDLLLDLKASLPEPYTRSKAAGWIMRNASLNIIRKLRDAQGRYVFDPSSAPGSASSGTLLGAPVYVDPSVPAMAVNAKSIVYGDISKYYVRQVNGIRFERSDDYAFGNDLVTFRGLARLDGALVDTTGAVKYFKNSAT